MKTIPVVIATLTGGIVIGYSLNGSFLSATSKSESASTNPNITPLKTGAHQPQQFDGLAAEIDDINRRMQQEISARRSLEIKLDKLSQQLASLEVNGSQPNKSLDVTEESTKAVTSPTAQSEWFNEQALIDSGMTYTRAAELKSFFEQQELDRMYLRDQSIREGWDRQKYREEIQKLSENAEGFLSQLDEQSYDAYLYASGQPNRVKVTNVLDSSQASSAGIQPGDHIISYDSKRIYSGFELRSATTSGDINQTIAVEVERNGEIIELYLTRGPLGIRMDSVSIPPSS